MHASYDGASRTHLNSSSWNRRTPGECQPRSFNPLLSAFAPPWAATAAGASVAAAASPASPAQPAGNGSNGVKAKKNAATTGGGGGGGNSNGSGGSNGNSNSDDEDEEDDEDADDLALPLPLPNASSAARWQNSVSSIGAGVVTAVFTTPFDVIRTRLAVQQSRSMGSNGAGATVAYDGIIGSCRTTFREEGFAGFWRGFGPTLFVVPFFWLIYFTSYSAAKERLAEAARRPDLHPRLAPVAALPLWTTHLLAACGAGAVANTLLNPLFVVRTRMQTQHMRLLHGGKGSTVLPIAMPKTKPLLYTSTHRALIRLVQEEGWLSLLRGVSASFLGLTHVAVQFPLFEHLKVALPQARHEWHATRGDLSATLAAVASASASPVLHPHQHAHTHSHSHSHSHAHPASVATTLELIAASSLSKIVASTFTFPHEVLRSRMQHAPKEVFAGLKDCASKTVRNEGWRALYKGFAVNLLRTVPGAALTLVSYEKILHHLDHRFPPAHTPGHAHA